MNKKEKSQKKENILILILVLVVISSIAAGILAVVDYVTQKPIQEAIVKSTIAAFKQLQPNFTNDPADGAINVVSKDGKKWFLLKKGEFTDQYGSNVVTFYPAKKDGKLVSLFAKAVSPIGYAGNVTVLLAMKRNGQIINVVVTENKETPGLGTVVFGRVVKKTIWGILKGEYKNAEKGLVPNPIMDFFNGKMYISDNTPTNNNPDLVPASKWKVIKDGGIFKYITGATITSRAVTYGVKMIAVAYYHTQRDVLGAFNKRTRT